MARRGSEPAKPCHDRRCGRPVVRPLHREPHVLGELMASGRSVKLKGVGSFYLTCQTRGKGTDTPEELTTDMLTDVKVRFIPEYSRGQRGQITNRTMIDKYLEWVEVADKPEDKIQQP